MKKISLIITLAFCAAMSLSSCGGGKTTNRLDEIKQSYNLPIDATVIKELGTAGSNASSYKWFLFTLNEDTLLGYYYTGGSYLIFTRVSGSAIDARAKAVADSTAAN